MPRYEIDKDNAVLVFYSEDHELPGLYQPFDPADETNTPFATKTKAKAWAEAYMKSLEAPAPSTEELAVDSDLVEPDPVLAPEA